MFYLQQFYCNSNCDMTLRLYLIIRHSHSLTNKEKTSPGVIHVAAGKIPNAGYTWHFGSLKRKNSQSTAINDWLILLDVECVGAIVNCTV